MEHKKDYFPVILLLLIIIADQLLKVYIKTHFLLGEQISVAGDWFYLHFTENNGMAFGLEFAGKTGKLLLSIFRIVAITILGYYLYKQIVQKKDKVLIYALALIFAGAFGNMIDGCFYGIIFNESYNNLAQLFPPEGGYAPFLFGRVVDMFYFPIIETHYPQWFPFWGGEEFIFFRPVFNLADAAISSGIGLMIVFQKRIFKEDTDQSSAQAQ